MTGRHAAPRRMNVERILERVVGPVSAVLAVAFLYWALWVTG